MDPCDYGDMLVKERTRLISMLAEGRIEGLVNASLLTYGFDCPPYQIPSALVPDSRKDLKDLQKQRRRDIHEPRGQRIRIHRTRLCSANP